MAFDVGSIEASLTLDRTKFSAGLKEAKAEALTFAKETFKASLGLDLEQFYADITEATTALGAISDETVNLEVDVDSESITQTAAEAESLATHIESLDPEMLVGADYDAAQRMRLELIAIGRQIESMRPTYKPNVDRTELIGLYREAQILSRQISALDPDFTVRANTGELRLAYLAAYRAKQLIDRTEASFILDVDDRRFKTKTRSARSWMRWFRLANPSTVLSLINDPFQASARGAFRTINLLNRSNPRVIIHTNAREVGADMNFMARGVKQGGDAFARFWPVATGGDGTKWRWLGNIASSLLNVGTAAGGIASKLASAIGGAGGGGGGGGLSGFLGLGAAGGGAAAKLLPLAGSIAATVIPATLAAGAIGLLLAAIAPLMAILAVGVGTIGLVGAGLATLIGPAALLTKDFGLLADANRRVENAQIKLSAAQKAGGLSAKKLAGLERELTDATKKQKSAEDELSKAWDRLNKLRDPKDSRELKNAEAALTRTEKEQKTNTQQLDHAWTMLARARKAENRKDIAHWENEISKGQKKQEQTGKKLDGIYARLNKLRNPKDSRAYAKAEQAVEKAEARVEKTTKAVNTAQRKLTAARKSGSSERIKQAERELAAAQNDQALALKRAGGNSKAYKNALQDLHKAAKPLPDAFRKAFVPAATRLANLATKTVNYTKEKLPALGKAADSNLRELAEGFDKGHHSSIKFDNLLKGMPPVMGDLGGISKNTGSIINSFLVIATPYIKDFTQWAEDASKRLAEWMDSEEGRKQIKKFFELAGPLAKELADFIAVVADWLWRLAVNHGPAVIDMIQFMTGAVDKLMWAFDKAAYFAGYLLEIWNALFKKRGDGFNAQQLENLIMLAQADGGTVTVRGEQASMGHGGTIKKAANGLASTARGAHYVEESAFMRLGNTLVNYGEALSGQHREYAFPMDDGGYRFITEQPGNDKDTLALWADLGLRKGFLGSAWEAGNMGGSGSSPWEPSSPGKGSGRSHRTPGQSALGTVPDLYTRSAPRRRKRPEKQVALLKLETSSGDFRTIVAEMVWEHMRDNVESSSWTEDAL